MVGPSLIQDRVKYFLLQLGTHGSQSFELHLGHKLVNLLLIPNTIAVIWWRLTVHKANIDAVIVKKSGGISNSFQDNSEILDTLAFLLELHGSTIINIKPNIEEAEANNIVCNFLRNAPFRAQLTDLGRCAVCNLIQDWAAGWVKALKILLLNGGL